ncbi:MFS general substrate transporter [Venustampulla echinocandica]|uniref:MFS general substrate transporter n=1 Tax=Venustampulla echinocandica TaxID=2656787 RepID=A0A370TQB5_9HELO|nr:MFS general substrate transporter [Venustampulla echinocandica]RDL37716.1 MFS general substrate transporter [Venustampulla echinocandica]
MSLPRNSSPPRIYLPERLYKIDHWDKHNDPDHPPTFSAFPRPPLSHRSSSSTLRSYAESTVSSISTLVGSTHALIKDEQKKQIPNLGMPILEGWPLALTMFSLCFGLFLVTLETTVISTSLVTISLDLGSFDKASWIVVTYLLTYTAFLVVFTRLSDIFGRKPCLLIATFFFVMFSMACACAKTMTQLIVFRALQGIGGSGIYALAYASVLDVVPMRLVGHASGAISMASACSSVLGPVLGGAITSNTTWRWVFWLNVPTGVIVFGLVWWIFPVSIGQQKFSRGLLAQVDWVGVVLSLTASLCLLIPLEEGGSEFAWSSILIVLLLAVSGISWVGFAIWEWLVTRREAVWKILPIFPFRLVQRRVIGATILTGFVAGFPFMVTVVSLPQRLQIVNNLSPASAGTHILPLLIMTALGAFASGVIATRMNIAWFMLVLSNALSTLGLGLMSSLPTSAGVPGVFYFYQVIVGLGFGIGLATLMIVSRSEVALEDNAITVGAITQVRTLGGVIGIAVVQAILSSHVRSSLPTFLNREQVEGILASTAYISRLDPHFEAATRAIYGEAVNLQMRTVTGFAAAAFVVSLFAYRKDRVDMNALEASRVAEKNGESPADLSKTTRGGSTLDIEQQERGAHVERPARPGLRRRATSVAISADSRIERRSSGEDSQWMPSNPTPWSLLSHPIPSSDLFPELACPRCGFSRTHDDKQD